MSREREREIGWESKVQKREDRERQREFEGGSPSEPRREQEWTDTRANWRDGKDIASFYFTRFPEDATEKDLWHHFKKFGDVTEIFISKNRNKNGRRYGFARFKDVEDVYNLERKLDNIVFGGLKMYVNIPKFGRDRYEKTNPEAKRVEYDEQKEKEAPNKDIYI